MSQIQIQLEIDTGAGDTALAGNCGTTSDLFFPLWKIAFGEFPIGDFHGRKAIDMLEYLSVATALVARFAIESLQWDRNAYMQLTTSQQAGRSQAGEYLIVWRDLCRKHPNCRVTILP